MSNNAHTDRLQQHFQNLDQLRNAITLTLETLQRTLDAADAEISAVRRLVDGKRPEAQA